MEASEEYRPLTDSTATMLGLKYVIAILMITTPTNERDVLEDVEEAQQVTSRIETGEKRHRAS
jgi:hypothetical protein